MRAVMRIAVVAPAVLMLASGCATKNWVREMVGQREAEIDQRVGTKVGAVETRMGEEAQRVTRVEGQLGTIEKQVGEVSEQAKQAHTRADAAFKHRRDAAEMMRDDLQVRVLVHDP